MYPLYGRPDPTKHHSQPPRAGFQCDFPYLGAYAEDRQPNLDRLFVEPARFTAKVNARQFEHKLNDVRATAVGVNS